jgi:hypothetical protein
MMEIFLPHYAADGQVPVFADQHGRTTDPQSQFLQCVSPIPVCFSPQPRWDDGKQAVPITVHSSSLLHEDMLVDDRYDT